MSEHESYETKSLYSKQKNASRIIFQEDRYTKLQTTTSNN